MEADALTLINDRAEVCKLPPDIQQVLFANGLVTTGGKKVCFCGLIQSGINKFVFLPRKASLDLKFLPSLFSVIRKYSKHSDNLYNSHDDGDNLVGQKAMQILTDILTDYHTYGLYTRLNRNSKTNFGKPNWSRTIKKFEPTFGSKGPVYLDYTGSINVSQADSEVSRIHAYIIKTLDHMFGDLLFGFQSYKDDGLLPPQKTDKKYLITLLKSEMDSLYSDRDIRLFTLLIKYLDEVYGEEETDVVIGIKSFHSLWEHMLKHTLAGTVDINKEFSIPTYIDTNDHHFRAAKKGQRTDIIIHNEDKNIYTIIDAKYYDAVDLNSAPGWGDLLKQFFYAKAVKSIRSGAEVRNFFIFPGSERIFKSVYMQKHRPVEKDLQYDQIQCLYVDPQYVMKAYLDDDILEEVSEEMVA